MTMRRHHMMGTLLLLLSLLAAQTWSAYVPTQSQEEYNAKQVDTIQEQQGKGIYNSRHYTQLNEVAKAAAAAAAEDNNNNNDSADNADNDVDDDATFVLKQLQLPHGSYDKNDDVVVVDDKAVLVSEPVALPQRNTPYDAFDAFDVDDNNNNVEDDVYYSAGIEQAPEHLDDADADIEENYNNHLLDAPQRRRRELADWFIAPNTRWCGRGNTANGTYNHLGGASAADMCCRRHDHCRIYISAMSNRYGVFNYRPYTLSHCNCDRRFRTCLKMANDEAANTIGKLFFNMVQTQCFTLRTEHTCLKHDNDGNCSDERVKKRAYLRNNEKF